MSERFTRLFALPAALYAEGSPLLLEAGALLRDNENGRLIAQLKLKNLGEKAVQAAKIRLWPQDPAGRPLGEPLVYNYLDQSAGRGDSFGAKNPIPVAEPAARSFRAELEEVSFADGSLWTAPEGALWEPLPPAEPLEKALGDPELAKQYRLRFGEQAVNGPARHRDLWLCACGALNRAEEGLCHACRRSRDEQLDCDLSALAAARDARIEAERAAAQAKARAEKAEKAKAKRKKAGKIVGITVPAALLIAAAILLGIPGLSAMQAKKAADAGDYIGAVEKYRSAAGWGLFNALFHPDEKAVSLEPAARYQEGEAALAEGRYGDALAAFEAAGDYEDADEQILAVHYQEGEAAFAEGRYADAVAAFEAAGDYKDAPERRIACLTEAIDAYVKAGELEKAIEACVETGALEKATELLKAFPGGEERNRLTLVIAQGYLDAGDYEEVFRLLSRTRNSDPELKERERRIRYAAAVGVYEKGNYSEAEQQMTKISGYREADRYIALCRAALAEEAAQSGNYSLALRLAKTVSLSELSSEEEERVRGSFYDWAKKIETTGKTAEDYEMAFALYEISGKGDYQTRMNACNQKYIKTPRQLTNSRGDAGNNNFRILSVSALYGGGKVTFHVEYTASRGGYWYLWEFSNEEDLGNGTSRIYAGARTAHGQFQAGRGSFDFTVTKSKELETFDGSWTIREWNIYLTGDTRYEEFNWSGFFDSWYIGTRSFFNTISTDLYGNPIP